MASPCSPPRRRPPSRRGRVGVRVAASVQRVIVDKNALHGVRSCSGISTISEWREPWAVDNGEALALKDEVVAAEALSRRRRGLAGDMMSARRAMR